MKTKLIYKLSIVLNLFFIIGLSVTIYQFWEPISKKFFDKKKAKIVMFGDSITQKGDWEALLNRDDVKNSAVGGTTTTDYVGMVHKNIVRYKPSICFIEGGMNDILIGISVERTKQNYRRVLDTLVANKIVPVVQSTLYQENNPDSKIMVDSINAFLADYCLTREIYYLNLNAILSSSTGLKPEYSLDGTHINEKAFEVWSEEVKRVLEKLEK
jgi:lysophospholipase L1-like esterase